MIFAEQLGRIKSKLPLARSKDPNLKVFGASHHTYELAPPSSEAEVTAFETQHHVQLPEAYRMFITHLGNGNANEPGHYFAGGAGPYYGLYALGNPGYDVISFANSAKPCLLYPNMSHADWEKRTAVLEQEDLSDDDHDRHKASLFQGLLCLGTQGCTYYTCLVMTGEHRGRIVYIDDELYRVPFFCYEKNFLDWYERWLDELIAGYDLDWFGTKMGGDDAELMKVFQESNNPETKNAALWSMFKLPILQKKTVTFLLEQTRHAETSIRFNAFRLLTKYDYLMAEPVIRTFLTSGDTAQQDIAIKSIFWYAKEHSDVWVNDIASFLPTINDPETFRFICYVLRESKQDVSTFLAPFLKQDNTEILRSTLYELGQAKNKERFIEDFIPLLEHPNVLVQLATMQALSGVSDVRLLPFYERILEQYSSNEHYILNYVLYRLKDLGAPAQTVLEKTLQHPNEEARSQAQKILSDLKPASKLLGWLNKN